MSVITFNQLPASWLLSVHGSILKANFLSHLSFIATAREGYGWKVSTPALYAHGPRFKPWTGGSDNFGFLSFSSIPAVKWWDGTSNQAMTISFRHIIQKMSYLQCYIVWGKYNWDRDPGSDVLIFSQYIFIPRSWKLYIMRNGVLTKPYFSTNSPSTSTALSQRVTGVCMPCRYHWAVRWIV
jgi:hypothetical protein